TSATASCTPPPRSASRWSTSTSAARRRRSPPPRARWRGPGAALRPLPAESSGAANTLDWMQPGERLAVIDLGSNSFRPVVFMAGHGSWRRTDEIYEPVRIGEGMVATGRLGEAPIERALATLDVFSHFCRASGLE